MKEEKKGLKGWCASLIWRLLQVTVLLPFLYLGWLAVRCFFMDYFSIPTNSMIPTLYPGDKVFVNKLIMGARIYTDFNFDLRGGTLRSWRMKGLRTVKRNDIVVFNFPYHDGAIKFVINHVYCKRVVALPGDSIRINRGFYQNNNDDEVLGIEEMQRRFAGVQDSMIPSEVLHAFPYADPHLGYTTKDLPSTYVPRKGDLIRVNAKEASCYKRLLEWETGKKITWDWDRNAVYANGKRILWHRFRNNYYFMAGDNVSDSNDSRYWGFVPEDYLIGVVGYVYHGKRNLNRH